MIVYNTRNLYFITFIVSIAIYIVMDIVSGFVYANSITKNEYVISLESIKIIKEDKIKIGEVIGQNPQSNDELWKVEIPKINLSAPIQEGTSQDVLDKYVGHFAETAKYNGTVGLAAHNRGYSINYFENLKKLSKGDEIIYYYKENQRKYIVDKINVIKDTDWSYLEENEEKNLITLITCIENEPNYRRCIQAVEKEENIE